jgi:hypothetical protein
MMEAIDICFNTGRDLNSLGLGLDILGVLALFRYGLPGDLFTRSVILDGSFPDGAEEKMQRRSRIALCMILTGFLLQMVSNYLPASSHLCFTTPAF